MDYDLEEVQKKLGTVKKECKRKNLDLQDMRKKISDERLYFESKLEETIKEIRNNHENDPLLAPLTELLKWVSDFGT